MPTYPTINLLLRHRKAIPWVVAAIFIIAGAWAFARTGVPETLVAGVVLAAALGMFVRCFVELIQIIADTLLPR